MQDLIKRSDKESGLRKLNHRKYSLPDVVLPDEPPPDPEQEEEEESNTIADPSQIQEDEAEDAVDHLSSSFKSSTKKDNSDEIEEPGVKKESSKSQFYKTFKSFESNQEEDEESGLLDSPT